MKNLLKYILLVFLMAVLDNAAGRFVISSDGTSSDDFLIEEIIFTDSFSSPQAELKIPHQTQLSGSARQHCNSRRTTGIHKSLSEALRSGKSLNPALKSVRSNSIIISTAVIAHSHKLVYLGKLVI